jgi:hypothetical protein
MFVPFYSVTFALDEVTGCVGAVNLESLIDRDERGCWGSPAEIMKDCAQGVYFDIAVFEGRNVVGNVLAEKPGADGVVVSDGVNVDFSKFEGFGYERRVGNSYASKDSGWKRRHMFVLILGVIVLETFEKLVC